MTALPIDAPQIDLARRRALRRPVVRDFTHYLTDLIGRWADGPRPAIVAEDGEVTYAELMERVEAVTAQLHRAGCRQGQVVAVVGSRGPAIIAAFLAIERLDAVYLPLDARWPDRRLRGVLRDSGAAALVAVGGGDDHAAREAASAVGVPVFAGGTSRSGSSLSAGPVHRAYPDADRPRYVFYTSGSTGAPKGALVTHGGLVNHLSAKVDDLALCGDDEVAFTAPLTFDISIWQMLAPMLVGGRVRTVGDAATDPARLAALLAQTGVTVLELVPTMLRLLLDELAQVPTAARAPRLRWLLATGEELPPALAARALEVLPHVRLLNAYGPTECSDDVTHHAVTGADLTEPRLPIGGPIANAVLYVLAEDDGGRWRACEPGQTGELFVGGVCVGPGYLADPVRTAEAFFADPFDPDSPTGRLYRTGDAVRLTHRGVLEYRGRVDRQVKVSGVRMELGEVEAVLREHPAVDECAVTLTLRRDAGALVARQTAYRSDPAPELVAYYVGRDEESDLAGYLRGRLPSAMVPRHWVRLPALPLSANGKVDYRALPAPDPIPVAPPDQTRPYEPPRDAAERVVAEAFASALDVPRVGREDAFDLLGGDSMRAMRVAARLREAGYALGVAELLTNRTVAAVASRLATATPVTGHDGQSPEDGEVPLTPEQHGVYFHWRLAPENPYYSYQGVLGITGPLDWSRLAAAWRVLLAENPNLGARIVESAGQPVQRLGAWEIPLVEPIDLGGHLAAARETVLREAAAADAIRPFDLAGEPIMRVRGYRLADGDHRVLVTMHEILLDGWGATTMFTRLAELYASGEPAADPLLAGRYRRFVAQRLARLGGPQAARAEEYWRGKLAGELPALDLPIRAGGRAGPRTYRGSLIERVCDARGLRQTCHQTGCTPFMVLLAGYAMALGYYCDADEVIIGTPIANRDDPAAIDLPTFTINMLPLRLALPPGHSLDKQLAEVRSTVLDAYAVADHPFSEVVRATRAARTSVHTPVFATMLNMLTYPAQRITSAGLTLEFTELDTGFTKYDCALYAQRHGPDGLLLQFAYQTDLIAEGMAEGLLSSTLAAVRALCGDRHRLLGGIDLLPQDQGVALDRFNRGS